MKEHNTQTLPDFHGSDVDAVAAYFGIPVSEIVSFAANVNPLGLSPLVQKELANHLDVLSQYPERDYHTLRQAIGQYVHAPAEHILVGNGSTELISGVIRGISPRDAVLVAPSYSEYEREVGLCGGGMRPFFLREETNWQLDADELLPFFQPQTDLLILCSPNNPTGSAVPLSTLRKILSFCQKNEITVMIDETYMEFSEHPEQFEAIGLTETFSNLVVLRGVSKFFAAPGLRLGYGVCSSPELRDVIQRGKEPWTINSLAAKAGELLFSDIDYQLRTRSLVQQEKLRVTQALNACNAAFAYPSEANFLLVKLTHTARNADDCFSHCAKQGLMIRSCSSFPTLGNRFLRICMMLPQDNDRLLNTLIPFLQNRDNSTL